MTSMHTDDKQQYDLAILLPPSLRERLVDEAYEWVMSEDFLGKSSNSFGYFLRQQYDMEIVMLRDEDRNFVEYLRFRDIVTMTEFKLLHM